MDTFSCTGVTNIGLLAGVRLANVLLHIVRTVEEAIASLPSARILLLPIAAIARRVWFRRWGERGVEQR